MTQPNQPPLQLTPEQSNAVQEIVKFFREDKPRKRRTFSLGGYAGTGKTTVIKEVIRALREPDQCKYCEGKGVIDKIDIRGEQDIRECSNCAGEGEFCHDEQVLCSAFTGKAVSVLRKKGLFNSQTLHSLMYHVDKDTRTGKVSFYKRTSIEPDFIIVDEASMLNSQLYNDLLSFNKPVLFVGDPGQLPPVGDNPNVMGSVEIVLEQIHRQAQLNPIIRFATDIRHGRMWSNGIHRMDDLEALDIRDKNTSMNVLLEVDQVITAFNKKRLEINRIIRDALEYREPLVVGEKVICLRNDRPKNLFNGLILKVTHKHKDDAQRYIVDLEDEVGNKWTEIPMLKRMYNGGFDPQVEKIPENACLFDYGYCITCHKSQGSEWDSVCVLEQWAHKNLWEMPRWQYTAATRAAKKLIYVR